MPRHSHTRTLTSFSLSIIFSESKVDRRPIRTRASVSARQKKVRSRAVHRARTPPKKKVTARGRSERARGDELHRNSYDAPAI